MKTKFVLSLLLSLLVSIVVGAAIAPFLGIPTFICVAVLLTLSFIPLREPSGSLSMSVLSEIWTGELLKRFRFDGTWLGRISSRGDLVKNNTVHIVDIGADPDVLINNTTYPIPSTFRDDTDVPIGLDKFDSSNTNISDDELYALPYDKKGSVIDQHNETLAEKVLIKSAHSIAPQANTAGTPIIETSGASNAETVARKRLLPADIIRMQKLFTKMKIPLADRIVVLCPEHVEDLLLVDEKFANQYKNIKTGEILPMFGFDIYTFGGNPKYSVVNAAYQKKAFAAADDDVNDHVASFFFYAGRARQFPGPAAKMFSRKAEDDPENRMSTIGFRLWHICIGLKLEGFGAIVSAST